MRKVREEKFDYDDSSFAGRYKAFRLVYLEVFRDVRAAISREKEIQGWRRSKKEALIRSVNPSWRDLSADWSNRFRPATNTKPFRLATLRARMTLQNNSQSHAEQLASQKLETAPSNRSQVTLVS
jgi:putative endonuclease